MSPVETRTCTHGVTLRQTQLPPGGWSGGVSECRCCFNIFGYIDSYYSFSTLSGGTITDKDRCSTCGGQVRKWEHESK